MQTQPADLPAPHAGSHRATERSCQCHLLSVPASATMLQGAPIDAVSLVLFGPLTFPFHLPTLSMTRYKTCTLGKKEPERLLSNPWLDSQGVFQHGSQRPLQVYWEWEVQILSRTLARKLPLSVCLAAGKWEGTALRFWILLNTHISGKWEPL